MLRPFSNDFGLFICFFPLGQSNCYIFILLLYKIWNPGLQYHPRICYKWRITAPTSDQLNSCLHFSKIFSDLHAYQHMRSPVLFHSTTYLWRNSRACVCGYSPMLMTLIILSLGLKYSDIMNLELIFRNKSTFMNADFYQKIKLLTF